MEWTYGLKSERGPLKLWLLTSTSPIAVVIKGLDGAAIPLIHEVDDPMVENGADQPLAGGELLMQSRNLHDR